jgi:hypothetical protein
MLPSVRRFLIRQRSLMGDRKVINPIHSTTSKAPVRLFDRNGEVRAFGPIPRMLRPPSGKVFCPELVNGPSKPPKGAELPPLLPTQMALRVASMTML